MLTVDANVWIAAADRSDMFYLPSRRFLARAVQQRLNIYLPSFAWIEIACALARRRQDAAAGRRLANSLLASSQVVRVQLDAPFLAQALLAGTQSLLRGADALYAATAVIHRTQLVSWDAELIQRAGAVTPTDWLVANP
jgi:predicted nucleic acid-binding protein